jgi:hypothetical protein
MRGVVSVLVCLGCCFALLGQEKKSADSPLVAKTRKKLDTAISVDFKDERLKDVVKELEEKAEVKFRLDTKGGVSQNMAFTYKAEEKPLRQVLADLFQGKGLGYVVHRKQNANDRYEGYLDIVQGDQRGDEMPAKSPGKKKP